MKNLMMAERGLFSPQRRPKVESAGSGRGGLEIRELLRTEKSALRSRWLPGLVSLAILLAGCKGVPTEGERAARADLEQVTSAYGGNTYPKSLPNLTTNSLLSDFLQYAMLNQPSVGAAYFDWAAAVERITVERSLPDPKLTFQAYITDSLTSLMPGLMQEFPWPGKLKAAGDVATAEARSKYFGFESAALTAAFSVKQSYYQLWFLEDKIRINREMLGLLADIEKSARARNESRRLAATDARAIQGIIGFGT
jgi:cobalt-zinc-cadmium efflux system outer membrane protein